MIDIVERLIADAVWARGNNLFGIPEDLDEAAAEITRLRAEAEAEALRNLVAEERDQCAMTVWMTLQEATADDADDKGLDGWMREAERRIRDSALDATKGAT